MIKKYKTLFLLTLALIVVIGVAFYPYHKNEPKKEEAPTSQQSTELKEYSQSDEVDTQEEFKTLTYFGKKWLDYSSIAERNNAVKDLFTKQAVKDNALDVDPHVEIKSTGGAVLSISKDIENNHKFIIVGIENINDKPTKTVLEIETVQENDKIKIDKLTINYVRQAY